MPFLLECPWRDQDQFHTTTGKIHEIRSGAGGLSAPDTDMLLPLPYALEPLNIVASYEESSSIAMIGPWGNPSTSQFSDWSVWVRSPVTGSFTVWVEYQPSTLSKTS